MYFYLVRHGEAKSELEDSLRPLSVEGKRGIERVTSFLRELGTRPQEINCSEKLRARETAEIIAKGLSIAGRVKAIKGLAPNDDVSPVADLLCAEGKSIMFVGQFLLVVDQLRFVEHREFILAGKFDGVEIADLLADSAETADGIVNGKTSWVTFFGLWIFDLLHVDGVHRALLHADQAGVAVQFAGIGIG